MTSTPAHDEPHHVGYGSDITIAELATP